MNFTEANFTSKIQILTVFTMNPAKKQLKSDLKL